MEEGIPLTLKVTEVASMLKISRGMAYQLTRRRDFPKLRIGKRIIIRPGTMLHGESNSLDTTIIIEDDVLIGCGVHIYVENHEFKNPFVVISEQGHSPAKQVLIKEGCWIGANVIILPGVTIGKNSVIGAGSIVTKSIEDNVVAAGNPARVIKKINIFDK